MIIGHTPHDYIDNDYDLENDKGDIIRVINVDGGVVFNNRLIKFTGEKLDISLMGKHNKYSNEMSEKDAKGKIELRSIEILKKFLNLYKTTYGNGPKNKKVSYDELTPELRELLDTFYIMKEYCSNEGFDDIVKSIDNALMQTGYLKK